MKARFKGTGTKTLRVGGETLAFPAGSWVFLPSIAFYKKIRPHKDVFDLVCDYNIQPLFPYERHLRFHGRSVLCGNKAVCRKLSSMSFLAKQAYIPETGVTSYRITTYSASYLPGFVSIGSEVSVLCMRSKGGIGDILMTTPVIEAIRERYFHYQVDYACPKEFHPLLKHNPFIRRIFTLAEVDETKYDIIYDMTHTCIQYEGRTQPNVDMNRPEIFAQQGSIPMVGIPRPKMYLTGEELGAYNDPSEPAAFEGEALRRFRSHIQNGCGRRKLLIGITAEASAKVRRYVHMDSLVSILARAYPAAGIIFFQKEQKHEFLEKNVLVLDSVGLREVATIINMCDIFIGPDSGLSHIASSLRIPTVWIFTHIDGKVRTKNYDTSSVIQATPPACPVGSPCWYRFPCDPSQSHWEHLDGPPCSNDLHPSLVLEQVRAVLSRPHLSFCVVCHNQFETTKECLDRILRNMKHTDELILVDNGSSDETQQYFSLAGSWVLNFKYIRNEKNLGCVLGRNQAMRAASGRFLFTLDNDQFISDYTLGRQFRISGDIVGVEGWHINETGLATRYAKAKMMNYVGAGGMLVKKEVAEDVGYFDERYSPAWFEDPDFCFMAVDKGYKLGLNTDSGIEHIGHVTNFTQKDFDSVAVWKTNREKFVKKWTGRRPLVSIVILTHNESAATVRCLQSVYQHTPLHQFEVIIIDNASRPGELEVVEGLKYPNMRIYPQTENLMVAAGRNLGATKARGNFLLFLDNDMMVSGGWLGGLLQVVDEEVVVAASPRVLDWIGDRERIRFHGTVIRDGAIHELGGSGDLESDFLPGGALFVYKDVFMKFPFDMKYVFGVEDYDWCMKMKKMGFRFKCAGSVTFVHYKLMSHRVVTPYNIAERERKGSSYIEDSVRLFLHRWRRELPNQWKEPGWLSWAVGEHRRDVTGVSELFCLIEQEVAKLHPEEVQRGAVNEGVVESN